MVSSVSPVIATMHGSPAARGCDIEGCAGVINDC